MANHRLNLKATIALVFCLFIAPFSSASWAIDSEREQVIAEKLTERLKIGSPVKLTASNGDFFAIFTESLTDEDKGVILILHGMSAHPDWPNVVTHLRTQLPLKDWSTLSIQMPILPADESVEQYGKTFAAADQRIAESIKYLKQQQYEKIVLVGYGFGAATALRFIAKNSDHSLLGVISISSLAQSFLRPAFNLLQQIESIQIPLLDIYGSLDYETIIESAPDRRLAARKADNIWYQQIEIEGADHNYSGMSLVLIKRIQGWLKKLIDNFSVAESAEEAIE